MKEIVINNERYVLGMTWFNVTSDSEIKQFQDVLGLSCGIIKKPQDKFDIVSSMGLAEEQAKGCISLANLLSYAYANMIFIHQIDEDKDEYWLCVIRNGFVVIEGDVVIQSKEQANRTYQQFLTEFADIDQDMLSVFSTTDGFENAKQVELKDFINDCSKYKKASTLVTLNVSSISPLSTIFVGIIVIGVLVGGYVWYNSSSQLEQPVLDPVAQVDRSKIYYENMARDFNDKGAAKVLTDVVTLLKNTSAVQQGWRVDGLSYNLNDPSRYRIKLSRLDYSTKNEIQKLYADNDDVLFFDVDVQGESATVTVPIESTNTTPQDIDEQYLRDIDSRDQTNMDKFISNLQLQYGLQYTVGSSTADAYLTSNHFTFNGDGIFGINRLLQLAEAHPTLIVDSVDVTISNNLVKWNIKGAIYG